MLLLTLLFALPVLTSSRYHRFQYKARNTQCHCVPTHLCSDDDVTLNGHGLLDPRTYRLCANTKEVCCDNPQQPEEKPALCGYSTNVKSRITSGTTTAFGELPWNLIIQENGGDKGTNIYKCGASLIHPKVAITAAHCVTPYSEEPEKLLVRAGEWNVDSHDEILPFQDNSVEEILVYYDYSPASLKNDIAILILSESFTLQENVGLLCLSTPYQDVVENSCIASGWGKNAHNKGKYSTTLKKIEVPIVARDHCLRSLRSTRLGPKYNLHKSFICAGGRKDEDSCKGDGGSPLICPLLQDKSRFVQVGIVSWGIGCGSEGIPGVYVNVPLYLDWIEDEMSGRDLDTSYFKV